MYKKINLLRDPIWPLLRKVTIPASIGSLFQTFYNLVDTYLSGQPAEVSAICNAVWTADVKAAWKAQLIANKSI